MRNKDTGCYVRENPFILCIKIKIQINLEISLYKKRNVAI